MLRRRKSKKARMQEKWFQMQNFVGLFLTELAKWQTDFCLSSAINLHKIKCFEMRYIDAFYKLTMF